MVLSGGNGVEKKKKKGSEQVRWFFPFNLMSFGEIARTLYVMWYPHPLCRKVPNKHIGEAGLEV